MSESIRTLVLFVWATLHPHALPKDACVIADAIVEAIVFRSVNQPVFGSIELDAVTMALWTDGESNVQLEPRPQSHDARDGTSCGPWQEPCAFVRTHTLHDQARYWLWLLHEGRKLCPESPAAPLSGGCRNGRPLAGRRLARAAGMLLGFAEPFATVF